MMFLAYYINHGIICNLKFFWAMKVLQHACSFIVGLNMQNTFMVIIQEKIKNLVV